MIGSKCIYELQARRKFQLDQASNLLGARQEGLAKGRSRTIRQAARPLQDKCLSLEAIASVFSVTQAELAQIVDSGPECSGDPS